MMSTTAASVQLHDAILKGDRRALARAITLIESTKRSDQLLAEELLTSLLPGIGKAKRIGISGAPGVGKSTFIEAFGKHLIEQHHRLAVLAVDPSSQRSGGSILGDKTRMETLARNPAAFIRPSPAGTTLGGVARRTREAVLLSDAAGFDVVVVETVGVGQSETTVSEMVDLFVLLIGPGGGDELQGLKRGVMELADLVLVTKADGDLKPAAARAASEYAHALGLMQRKYADFAPGVAEISALEGQGIAEAWRSLSEMHGKLSASGTLQKLRQQQVRQWFRGELQLVLAEEIFRDAGARKAQREAEEAAVEGRLLPTAAARMLVGELRGS